MLSKSRLVRTALFICALITLSSGTAQAESSVLVPNASIPRFHTARGDLLVHQTAVTFDREVTVLLLSDTLRADDLPRVRISLMAGFNPAFLRAHLLRVVDISGAKVDAGVNVETTSQLQASVHPIAGTAGPTPSFLDVLSAVGVLELTPHQNWTRVVIVGRLPTPHADSLWLSALLAGGFRKQRASVSFCSIDGAVPNSPPIPNSKQPTWDWQSVIWTIGSQTKHIRLRIAD